MRCSCPRALQVFALLSAACGSSPSRPAGASGAADAPSVSASAPDPAERGKECKGAISGEVSRACEAADTGLSSAIVAEIRGGLAIPTPDHLP